MPAGAAGFVRRNETTGWPARPTARADVMFTGYGTVEIPYTGPGAYIQNHDRWVDVADVPAGEGVIEWGFYTNRPTADNPTNWALTASVMNGTIRRSFSSTLPANFSSHSAAGDAAVGANSMLSVKPPGNDWTGMAAGAYDSLITSFCASCPDGVYVILFHEPEDDMTGPEFVAMFDQFYQVGKTANPDIKIGYAAMEYQWDLRFSQKAANPDDWMPQDIDFLGIDVYAEDWKAGHPPIAVQNLQGFSRWYAWAASKGIPLVITEVAIPLTRRTGNDPYTGPIAGSYTDQERATWITNALNWFKSTGKFEAVMWWNGDQFSYVDAIASNTAPHDSPLALAAWNAGTTTQDPGPTGLANGQSANANSGVSNVVTQSVTLPSIQTNDFVLAVCQWNAALTSTPTFTAGWTLLGLVNGGTTSTAVLYKIGAGTDTGATFNASWATPTTLRCAIQVHTWHGANPTSSVNAFASNLLSSSTVTHVMPNVSATVDDCWVINILAAKESALTAVTPGAGRVERDLFIQGGTGTNMIGIWDSDGVVAAGAITGGTFTSDVAMAAGSRWSIVVAPATT
jgi:hypothetical protein